jgi:hypothetical protein
MKKADLITRYQLLRTGNSQKRQTRGYEFEKLLFDLLEFENLKPSPSYKLKGEQIDGLFEFEHKFFLLECKWEKDEMPASQLYTFQGKVERKLVGGLSIFISMSNFSIDCPQSIEKKPINMILFTKEDMDYCFSEGYTFSKILKVKLRYAAQYGSVLYPFLTYLQK